MQLHMASGAKYLCLVICGYDLFLMFGLGRNYRCGGWMDVVAQIPGRAFTCVYGTCAERSAPQVEFCHLCGNARVAFESSRITSGNGDYRRLSEPADRVNVSRTQSLGHALPGATRAPVPARRPAVVRGAGGSAVRLDFIRP